MTDALLRRPKEFILTPIARLAPQALHPTAITLFGLVPGIGAALAAADERYGLALALWLLNRLLDGLDGTLARHRRRDSPLGAYIDITADFVVYAALPLGLGFAVATSDGWTAVAVLLASFYVNTISWAYLAALLERRGRTSDRAEFTSVTMPGGLIEGAETIVLFSAMLVVPSAIVPLMWAMAVAVAITVAQRVIWACRNL